MIRRLTLSSLIALLPLTAALAAPPSDEAPVDPDWPCQQQLVPEIAAAQVWTGNLPESSAAMTAPPELSELGRAAMSPSTPDAKVTANLREYFAKIKDRKKINDQAPLVFVIALNEANAQRAKQLHGIKAFSRGQMALSQQLAKDVSELDRLTNGQPAREGTPEKAVEDRTHMEQRVFEDREHQIRFLCEAPATGEQRIGLVATTLQDILAGKKGH